MCMKRYVGFVSVKTKHGRPYGTVVWPRGDICVDMFVDIGGDARSDCIKDHVACLVARHSVGKKDVAMWHAVVVV